MDVPKQQPTSLQPKRVTAPIKSEIRKPAIKSNCANSKRSGLPRPMSMANR